MMSEARYGAYAGETHVVYRNKESIDEAIEIIKKYDKSDIKFIDKIVQEGAHNPNPNTLHSIEAFGYADVWILLRHPLAISRSLKEKHWRGDGYVLAQFQFLQRVIDQHPNSRIVSIYDLFTPDGREKLFGTHMRDVDTYKLKPTTGKPVWGDVGENIRSGKLITKTEEADSKGKPSKKIEEAVEIYNLCLEQKKKSESQKEQK